MATLQDHIEWFRGNWADRNSPIPQVRRSVRQWLKDDLAAIRELTPNLFADQPDEVLAGYADYFRRRWNLSAEERNAAARCNREIRRRSLVAC